MKHKRYKSFLLSVLTAAVLAAVVIIPQLTGSSVFNPPEIRIGHAVSDENGQHTGGKAGDQTAKEVLCETRRSNAFHVVLRAKKPPCAEAIAAAMEAACANDNIGYDQYERTTLFEQAKQMKWSLADITQPCETDCSALVAVCVNAAGIDVSKDIYTGNLQQQLMQTGQFELLDDSAYIGDIKNLQRGDILLRKGHTAVVLREAQ